VTLETFHAVAAGELVLFMALLIVGGGVLLVKAILGDFDSPRINEGCYCHTLAPKIDCLAVDVDCLCEHLGVPEDEGEE
jgi:hypothetical protein